MSLDNFDVIFDQLLLDRIKNIVDNNDDAAADIDIFNHIIGCLVRLFGKDTIIGNIVLYNVLVENINERLPSIGCLDKKEIDRLKRLLIDVVHNYYNITKEYPELVNWLLFECFNSKEYFSRLFFDSRRIANIDDILWHFGHVGSHYLFYVDKSGIFANIFIRKFEDDADELIFDVLISCNNVPLFKAFFLTSLNRSRGNKNEVHIHFNKSLLNKTVYNFAEYFHDISYYLRRYDFVEIFANILSYINNVLQNNYGVSIQNPGVLLEQIQGILAETVNDSSRGKG